MMADERIDMPEQAPPAMNWQMLGVIFALGVSLIGFFYSTGEQSSAAKAIQENHTAQIAQLQITINGQQTLLYAINDSLARLTQKIEDEEAYRASQRKAAHQ